MDSWQVKDFASAAEFLSGGRSKDERPLQNNTRLVRRSNDAIAVRLHETDVLTYHRNGNRTLNSGGWLTVTTKDRINNYLGIKDTKVFSDRGQWFVFRYDETGSGWSKLSEFYDGVVIRKNGMVAKPKMPSEADNRKVAKMKRDIKAYIDGFVETLRKGMPQPNNGDCWFCLFKDAKSGKTWGDIAKDSGHLLDHMKERYYVPILVVNAVTEKGYRMPGFILGAKEDGTMGGQFFVEDAVRQSLRRYLHKRLIPNRQAR